MMKNMGGIDRILRAIVGLALVAAAIFADFVWGWVGVVPLLTAAIGFCPAYTLFGIRTCSAAK